MARASAAVLITATMTLGALMCSIDGSIVNVALPSIAADFGTDTSAVSWVSISYYLTMCGFMIPFARIADGGNIRAVYLSGFIAFAAFSLICGVSTSLGMLVVARAFHGISAAALASVTPIICVKLLPGEHLGRNLGFLALASSLGYAIGPSMGGMLSEFMTWHWIFLINVPIAAVALALGHGSLPREERSEVPVDIKGFVLLFVGITFSVLALERLSYPEDGLVCAASAVVGVASLMLFAWECRRSEHPLLDLRLFRIRNLGLALSAYTLLNLVYMGVLYVLPFYMEKGLGMSSAVSGMVLLIPSVFVLVMSIPVGNYTDRRGRRGCSIAASAITLGYFAVLLIASPEMGLLPVILASVMMGVVWGFSGPAASGRVVDNTPPESKAFGSSLMRFMGNMASTLGTAMFASLLTLGSSSGGVPIEDIPLGSFMDGVAFTMVWAIALSVAGVVCAVLIADGRRRSRGASGKS